MKFHKYLSQLLAASLLLQGCATVGKDEPFKKFKTEVSSLKTDTEGALDIDKLGFTTQLKTEIQSVADEAADQYAKTTGLRAELAKASKELERIGKEIEAGTAEIASINAELGDPAIDPKEKMELQKKRKGLEKKNVEFVEARSEAEEAVTKAAQAVEIDKENQQYANKRLEDRVKPFDLSVTGGDPYGWGGEKMPSYFKLVRARANAVRCMKLAEEYSDLLAKLANPGLIDEARFQKSADQLNSSLAKLSGSGQGAALFSTAAIYTARVYLQNRQARDLQKFLNQNQANIERFSKLMEDFLAIFIKEMNSYYSKEFRMAEDKIHNKGEDGKAGRAAGASSLVTVNQQYIVFLETLKELRTRYRKLPEQHLALAKSVVSPSLSLAYVNQASDQAAALGTQYERSLNRNQYESALLVAKASDQLAVGFERKATAAEADTALAKSDYDIAQAVSEANPVDQLSKDKALEKKKIYFERKLVSDGLRAKATYYRAQANLDKGDADRVKPPADPAPAAKP